tara:strand:- start:2947 stop:3156 length:210 start_codon:yes stop_codon:yes gene_type:complete
MVVFGERIREIPSFREVFGHRHYSSLEKAFKILGSDFKIQKLNVKFNFNFLEKNRKPLNHEKIIACSKG